MERKKARLEALPSDPGKPAVVAVAVAVARRPTHVVVVFGSPGLAIYPMQYLKADKSKKYPDEPQHGGLP